MTTVYTEYMRTYQARRRAAHIAAQLCQDCGEPKEAARATRRCCEGCAAKRNLVALHARAR